MGSGVRWRDGQRDGEASLMSLFTHPEQVLWKVSSIVDSSVHRDEAFHRWLVLHVGVVEAGVQHDDSKRQHIARI